MSQVFVYLLHHIHVIKEGDEDLKLVGVFSSRERALFAIDELKHESGFKGRSTLHSSYSAESGFYISEVALDEMDWKDGFVAPDIVK